MKLIDLLKRQIEMCKRLSGRLLLERDIHKCEATEKHVALIHEIIFFNGQILEELEQQPEPTEVSKNYGRVLDAVVAAFATTSDEIIQQKVQVAVDQGRKVCRELDLQAEENKQLRELLKDAKCSNKFCRNGTIIPPIDMPYTCKWCKAKAQVLQERKVRDGEEKAGSKTTD